jgi:hypothetical protein
MPQALPDLSQLLQAIELYLARAYDGPPPRAVRERLEQIQHNPDPWSCPAVERTMVGSAPRLSLRLGNRFYPHMKLSIDRAPDGRGCLFRADTHDRHLSAPAGSREQAMLQKLSQDNQRLAQQIEADWEAQGLRTFKTYLRDDLARRRASTS